MARGIQGAKARRRQLDGEEQERTLELSERDARAFYEALQSLPLLNEKLCEAMRQHRETVDMR